VRIASFKSRRARVALGLALTAVCAAAVGADARGGPGGADVAQVRLGGDSTETRIVVDLDRTTTAKVEAPDAPTSLALVFKETSAGAGLAGAGRGLVRDWRISGSPAGARLTLNLSQPAMVEHRFLLPPADGIANYRYVIDLAPLGGATPRTAAAVARPLRASVIGPTATPPQNAIKVVVIDPGHGGRDSGAIGAGSYEKNVTLAAALALKDRLERTGRYRVVMTRDADVYVPLEQRVRVARRAGADLFLSLHADSGADPSTHGASVYTLSEHGASRVGYVLGRREWFLQEAAQTNDQAVGQILLDLTQRTTRNRSATFAQTLIERVGDRAPLLPRSQRDAGYFVLLAPDVPAALLEMGFITNTGDEARLNDPKSREVLVAKIAQAVDGYFGAQTKLAAR
jgi:N-acetylmuramoyl-L-alanine amidase